MVRILQLGMGNEENIGGIELYLINQYRHLNKKNFVYDFLHVQDLPIAFGKELCLDSKIYRLAERRLHPVSYYKDLFSFFWKIRNENYDVIVMNLGGLSHALPLLLAQFINIPMRVVHSHTAGDETNIGMLRRIQYAINRKIIQFSATDYWTCSKNASRFLFHHEDAKIVHNGIETKKFVFSQPIRNNMREKLQLHDKFVIGHVGRFSPVKNHFFLVDVFYELHKKINNAILLLVGDDSHELDYDGYVSEIKRKISEYGLSENVIFTGFDEDTSKYYQAMDVFCLPSISEGLSLCTLEAQASDLPCVVSVGVPDSVKVIEDIEFLPLDDMDRWVNKLDEYAHIKRNRRNNYKVFCTSGYDAEYSTREVENYFLEGLKNV